MFYLGSLPPTDGKWETWASLSGQNPFPIQYGLLPVNKTYNPLIYKVWLVIDCCSTEISDERSNRTKLEMSKNTFILIPSLFILTLVT